MNKTKWYEEKPGVTSAMRIMSMITVIPGIAGFLLGCAMSLFGSSFGPQVLTGSVTVIGLALGTKVGQKAIEEKKKDSTIEGK